MTIAHPRPATGTVDELEAYLDVDRYPIHLLGSPQRAELLAEVRHQMRSVGCSCIREMVRPEAIAAMKAEADTLLPHTFWAQQEHNPYASVDDDSFPPGHPRRFFQQRRSGFINADLLPQDSPLNRLYNNNVLTHFIWDALEVDRPIYQWADPLGRNPYGVMAPGHYFPWHFDGNDFTVSILVQKADSGGVFEWVPSIRSPRQENYEAVQHILEGGRDGVNTLDLRPGDMQLFMGRYSMHRVTHIEGDTTRLIALPTYVHDPYRINTPHHSINYYGRATEMHHRRLTQAGDGLQD